MITKQYVALTFDDGPSIDTTAEILDLLELHQIPATFFVNGCNIREDTAEVMRRAVRMGCEIENHSEHHLAFSRLTSAEQADEIASTSEKITQICGTVPRFFRPPFLDLPPAASAQIPLTLIAGCGADDWNDTISAEERVKRIFAQVSDGTVILLHDMSRNCKTVSALRRLIPMLKNAGYTFLTIADLFAAHHVKTRRFENIMYSNVKLNCNGG